jgi:hypothetical protein
MSYPRAVGAGGERGKMQEEGGGEVSIGVDFFFGAMQYA